MAGRLARARSGAGILLPMMYAALRYLLPFIAILVVGPLAGHLTGALRGHDGGADASLLVGAAPMSGVLAGLGAMGLALAMGVVASRLVGNRMGLFCAGLVLAWAAWGTGRVDLILARTSSGVPLHTLALEGAMVGLLGVMVAAAILFTPIMRSALSEVRDPQHQHHHLAREPMGLLDSGVPFAMGAALLASGVAVWLLSQETLKGQTFGAAVVAGVFGAGAARVASQRVSAVWVFLATAILAAGGPLIASLVHSTPGAAMHAAQAGRLFALARPLPLDLVAGAFVGVPIGLGWASSMVEKHGGEQVGVVG